MNKETTRNFKEIILDNTPLIDVRAPIEYEKGAFTNSYNLPIMNDEERRLVGIKYKNAGNEKATELGYSLVSGSIKDVRVQGWNNFCKAHPNAMMYCFRGGNRSQIAQTWLKEEYNLDITRLEGGYKAFRNYLIEALQPENITMRPLILGGCTGSGKTLILNQLENSVDLEGIANHRGSSFGRHVTPQPTQINFENQLAYRIVQNQAKGYPFMLLEDEGTHIGSCHIPKPLFAYINTGDLVIADVSLEKRIEITLDEYVTTAQVEYIEQAASKEEGLNQWFDYIIGSVSRLKKALGGARLDAMLNLVTSAYLEQLKTGSIEAHKTWIRIFLEDYYDPMYQYQINQNLNRIIYRGNETEVLEYLKERVHHI